LILGVVPIGVTAPRGETKVRLSPARRELVEVGRPDPTHEDAVGRKWRRCERLPLHDRRRQAHARDRGDALGHLVEVGQRRFERLDQEMAIETENLVEQFRAKAVHHGHDDDERGDAEHDAKEGEAGDDRDESFLAPRPQIAQRQHPLEGGEGPRTRRVTHGRSSTWNFHAILADSRH
jgi:hypothetical protein